jgi:hypothetical protein
VRNHWTLGIHDVTCGAICDMKLSHDELFLITVGNDGNVFVFSLVAQEELERTLAGKKAEIPKGRLLDNS